uniref:Uncharacterized protein n=1 Tax=Arundo donax TaxID=35708 RepID=A0A0A9DHR0_ARUDO
MEASSPGLLLSTNTLIRKPFSRTSTLTNGVSCADAISWFSFAIFCFRSLMYVDASAMIDILFPCMAHLLYKPVSRSKLKHMWKMTD